MRTEIRVSPGVLVALAVAVFSPFVLLLAYALLWTAYDALGVSPRAASWLSLASLLVLPAYTGRTAYRVVATVAPSALELRQLKVPSVSRPRVPASVRALGDAVQVVPPPSPAETTTEFPPCPDVPAAGAVGSRFAEVGS